MKLVTFALKNNPALTYTGIWDGDQVIKTAADYPNMVALIEAGGVASAGDERFSVEDVILKAPLLPRKIVCVGRNYVAHAEELGNVVPDSPLLFVKLTTTVIGIGDTITWRTAVTEKVERWEGGKVGRLEGGTRCLLR